MNTNFLTPLIEKLAADLGLTYNFVGLSEEEQIRRLYYETRDCTLMRNRDIVLAEDQYDEKQPK